jgi:hypothetical protein
MVTDQRELQRKAGAIAGTATGFNQRNTPRPESVRAPQRVAVDRQAEHKAAFAVSEKIAPPHADCLPVWPFA